jgi:hypothetical protein
MKSDDLLARILKQDLAEPRMKDRHRIAFIAMRDPIEQALKGGATAKRIWTLLRDENKISCSYYTFSRYVNSLILHKNEQKKTQVKSSAKAVEKPQQITPKEKSDTNIIKSFVYDPLRFTKEDLL